MDDLSFFASFFAFRPVAHCHITRTKYGIYKTCPRTSELVSCLTLAAPSHSLLLSPDPRALALTYNFSITLVHLVWRSECSETESRSTYSLSSVCTLIFQNLKG
jgi:hypothetical protein